MATDQRQRAEEIQSRAGPQQVRRTIGRAKQFFNSAVKHELIGRNPFENEASAVGSNEERLFMIPAEWIESCIRKAPCEDWRIIMAFARYAGMRSHETPHPTLGRYRQSQQPHDYPQQQNPSDESLPDLSGTQTTSDASQRDCTGRG